MKFKTFSFILTALPALVWAAESYQAKVIGVTDGDTTKVLGTGNEQLLEALKKITGKAMLDEGRVYGGGMHKMEPKELTNVPATEIQALFNNGLAELQPEIFAA